MPLLINVFVITNFVFQIEKTKKASYLHMQFLKVVNSIDLYVVL